ncbi:S1 RNA-binding domain-containing protein [Atopobacter sp. AH10]|uniref:CvfD/Ygs/GSP13 family RNA-binding post-transcriptional regulator n=1 Tax=Atopobacter sp. AH10 TaxID=2315861 RepID=UPI000EF1CEC5|nr:CvfD/Ygs/GSP13 family RNA-binding post-transcriptional regulator [Atopobacter sp. AH10]RLK62778.1 S1 RNA-binding domain-containing protein [Atopobacter sp. AH10]
MKELVIGDIMEGTVTGVQAYGLFVLLDNGQQGLVHISECAHGFVSNLTEQYKVKERVKVQVVDLDPYTKKLSLSIRSLEHLNYPNKPKRWRSRRHQHEGNGFLAIAEAMPRFIDEAND